MKILVAGDYAPQNRIQTLLDKHDYSFFNEIKNITNNYDLAIVNLEAPITKGTDKLAKFGPNLKAPDETIVSVKYAGFNLVTLANNHIMDYGDTGLQDTLKICETEKINTVGVGNNIEDAEQIFYFTAADGLKVAIINCCEHEFSVADTSNPGANPLNPIRQYYKIKEAKNSADVVLVIVHGGIERYQLPTSRMVETYRFFIEAGADCVINHHQHCFSGFEEYKGKPIFYGLGNLCFDIGPDKGTWHEGFMVSLDITEHTLNYKLIPYCQCDENPAVSLVEPKDFNIRLSKLNNIISDSTKLKQNNDKHYKSDSELIKSVLTTIPGRILNKIYRMKLLSPALRGIKVRMLENYIQCESHRDKVLAVLKTIK